MLCEVLVGIPFPPGLHVGNTQTGFHPFIESSALRVETPSASNGTCAAHNTETKTTMCNPARALCMIVELSSPNLAAKVRTKTIELPTAFQPRSPVRIDRSAHGKRTSQGRPPPDVTNPAPFGAPTECI
jgi:hypothetical protein